MFAGDSTDAGTNVSSRRSGGSLDQPYPVAEEWATVLHEAINAPWPCPESERFGEVWDATIGDLTAAGLRVGRASYGGWNDGDRAQAEAIWCLVAHMRPTTVVETGVAHGLTSRVILEGLKRNGSGQLWSIDLPAVDPALTSRDRHSRPGGSPVPLDLCGRNEQVAATATGPQASACRPLRS